MDRFMVVIAACVLLLGCVRRTELQPTATLAEDDRSILETVLYDLSTYNGPGRPLSLVPVTPRDIYFLRKEIEWKPDPIKPLDHAGVLASMGASELVAVKAAIENLARRNESKYSYQNFHSATKVIKVVETAWPLLHNAWPLVDDSTEVPYGAQFPIQSWSPGYSADGSFVVLHLYFSEILHPSAATYVLTREKTGWGIKYRGFITWI